MIQSHNLVALIMQNGVDATTNVGIPTMGLHFSSGKGYNGGSGSQKKLKKTRVILHQIGGKHLTGEMALHFGVPVMSPT